MTVQQFDIKTAISLVSIDGTEPVTSSDIKKSERIDSSDEDGLISGWITAAREMVENDTDLILIDKTFDFYVDRFPTDDIEIPVRPISTIVSLKYQDASNVQQTWGTSNYQYDLNSFPIRIRPARGVAWPTIYEEFKAVVIRCTATSVSAPQRAIQAIQLLVGDWYWFREDSTPGNVSVRVESSYRALVTSLNWGNAYY